MAITIDSSSPAQVSDTSTASGSVVLTTASFTPPAKSVIVAICGSGRTTSGSISIGTTGQTLSWHVAAAVAGANNNDAVGAVFYAYCPSSVAMTVSTTHTVLAAAGTMLQVQVLTGTDAQSQPGWAVNTSASSATTAGEITFATSQTGSMVFGISITGTESTTFNPLANTTQIGSTVSVASTDTLAAWHQTTATGSPASTTFGGTWGSAGFGSVAAVEFLLKDVVGGTATSSPPAQVTGATYKMRGVGTFTSTSISGSTVTMGTLNTLTNNSASLIFVYWQPYTLTLTSASASNVTGYSKIISSTMGDLYGYGVFLGTTNTVGSATLSVVLSGTPTLCRGYSAEASTNLQNPTWATVSTGWSGTPTAPTTTVESPYPGGITGGLGDLFWSYWISNAPASAAGTTPGFTYNGTGGSDLTVFANSLTTTTPDPTFTFTDAVPTLWFMTGAVLRATGTVPQPVIPIVSTQAVRASTF